MAKALLTLLLVLFVVSAEPVHAAEKCPTQFQKGNGVLLVRTEPYYSSLFLAGDGDIVLEKTMFSRDGVLHERQTSYYRGLFAASQISNRGKTAIVRKKSPGRLFPLKTGSTWSSTVEFTRDGKSSAVGHEAISVGAKTSLNVGDCRYEVFEVQIITKWESGRKIIFKRFFEPSLGIPLLAIRMNEHGQPISEVRYDRIRFDRDH